VTSGKTDRDPEYQGIIVCHQGLQRDGFQQSVILVTWSERKGYILKRIKYQAKSHTTCTCNSSATDKPPPHLIQAPVPNQKHPTQRMEFTEELAERTCRSIQ
jgi:hypothetical protein